MIIHVSGQYLDHKKCCRFLRFGATALSTYYLLVTTYYLLLPDYYLLLTAYYLLLTTDY